MKPLIRELTQQNIAAIQKIINKGSVAEVKVEKGFIVVIEINRKSELTRRRNGDGTAGHRVADRLYSVCGPFCLRREGENWIYLDAGRFIPPLRTLIARI
ncbi:MAG: hypothetical protein ACLUFA_06990 [[Clostridium] leptum]